MNPQLLQLYAQSLYKIEPGDIQSLGRGPWALPFLGELMTFRTPGSKEIIVFTNIVTVELLMLQLHTQDT